MPGVIHSIWKVKLDSAETLEGADFIVNLAIREATREELVDFTGDLYEEFIGPDPVGGEVGTQHRIQRIAHAIDLTDDDIRSLGIDPTVFNNAVFHG